MRPRYILRKRSRDAQRALRRAHGPAVRVEPARNDYCPEHFRQLPCKRCPDHVSPQPPAEDCPVEA